MKIIQSLTTIILLSLFYPLQVEGQQKISRFTHKGKELSYTIQLPQNFDGSKSYPVLIGPSDARSVNDESYYWQGTEDSSGWILIGYRIYNATSRINEIKALLEHLKNTYNVEGNKFHTVCFSANSASIFNLVMELPEYFQGVTGMAGNPNNSSKEKLKKLQGVKVQFIVGERDTYWMRSAKKSHQLLQEVGVESSIEIIENGKHVLTQLIGKGFLERAKRLRK